MRHQVSGIIIFFSCSLIMLLTIAIQLAGEGASFWAVLYPNGFVVAEIMLEWGLIFIVLTSVLAICFAHSFSKYRTIKISYIVVGFIVQLVICVLWLLIRLPDFILATSLRSDDKELMLALFLLVNIELVVSVAVLVSIILMKCAFEKEFTCYCRLDKKRNNFLNLVLFVIMFCAFCGVLITLLKFIKDNVWSFIIDEFMPSVSFSVIDTFSMVLTGLLGVCFIHFKRKISFTGFALIAVFINLLFASVEFSLSFTGYVQLSDALKLVLLQKISSAIIISTPLNLIVFCINSHILFKSERQLA